MLSVVIELLFALDISRTCAIFLGLFNILWLCSVWLSWGFVEYNASFFLACWGFHLYSLIRTLSNICLCPIVPTPVYPPLPPPWEPLQTARSRPHSQRPFGNSIWQKICTSTPKYTKKDKIIKNHEKIIKKHEKTWNFIKKHEKSWKIITNQWKSLKIIKNQWKS